MTRITRLDKFSVPLTGQEIELQQLDYEGGGMSQIRIRIRERSRFTILDVDPITARHWGDALRQWSLRQMLPPDASGRGSEQAIATVGAASSAGGERDA